MILNNQLIQVKNDIINQFPNFNIDTIACIGEGMDSVAYDVNHRYIFRFPKYKIVSDKLQVEICLLPKLANVVKLTIPKFEYIGKQQENNYSFVGYKKIEGTNLEEANLSKNNPKLQTDIATFLQQIHNFPLAIAKDCGVEVNNFKDSYTDNLDRMRKEAYPLLDEKTIKYIEQLHNWYLDDEENFAYSPTLIHADFGPGHIFLNDDNRLFGVIDFGDVEIGDPDYDLMQLYEAFGEEFIKNLLQNYSHSDFNKLMKKLDFFSRCNTVHDVLLGFSRNSDGLIDWALNKLQNEANNYLD